MSPAETAAIKMFRKDDGLEPDPMMPRQWWDTILVELADAPLTMENILASLAKAYPEADGETALEAAIQVVCLVHVYVQHPETHRENRSN